MSQQYRAAEGETVDQICRHYYGYSSGAIEAVYNANPGLAEHGPFLPAGIVITLPVLTARQERKTGKKVELWD